MISNNNRKVNEGAQTIRHFHVNDLRKKLTYEGPKKESPPKDKILQGQSSIGDNEDIAKSRLHVKAKQGGPDPLLRGL